MTRTSGSRELASSLVLRRRWLIVWPSLDSATRTLLLQKIASWQSLTSVFERNCRRLEAQGADASRFAFALSSLVEASVNEAGGGELAEGVRGGLRQVAGAYEQLAGVADARVSQTLSLGLQFWAKEG